jgi:hypothetical protein
MLTWHYFFSNSWVWNTTPLQDLLSFRSLLKVVGTKVARSGCMLPNWPRDCNKISYTVGVPEDAWGNCAMGKLKIRTSHSLNLSIHLHQEHRKAYLSQVQWSTTVIPLLRRWKSGGSQFEASLGKQLLKLQSQEIIWAWWGTSVILIRQEVKIGRITLSGQSRQKSIETSFQWTSWHGRSSL